MKRYIRSTNIIPDRTIQVGMFWDIDGHEFSVLSRKGNTCKIRESWITEDLGRPTKHDDTYAIDTDNNGTEFAYMPNSPRLKFYSTNAFNYPYEKSRYSPAWDKYWDTDADDEDEDYTPSAYRGDYSPSSPWNAPGMSISDFI